MNTKPIRGYNPSDIYIDDQPNFIAKNLAALKVLNEFNSLFIHHNVFVSVSRNGIHLGKYHRENKHPSRIVFSDVVNTISTNYMQIDVNRRWLASDESHPHRIVTTFCPYENIIKMTITCYMVAKQFSQRIHLKPINLCDLIQ